MTQQYDAFESVLDEIVLRLTNATAAEGALEEVNSNSIIRGDKAGHTPQPPALWVFPGDVVCRHATGLTERWEMQIWIVCVVNIPDADAAQKLSQKLTSRAMTLIVADRRLGKNYVQDVQKVRFQFQPPRRPQESKGLHATAGEMKVIMQIREEDQI